MNEIIRRSNWAPDTGNAEILAMFGTEQQKAKYLQPLMDGEIVSCFSMTESQGGADPGVFTCRATHESNEWVINGEKRFSSGLPVRITCCRPSSGADARGMGAPD
jgi:acyl-CoA dehydrogenase